MKGILMKTWEVRALLAGRKTVTRRVVKPQPGKDAHSPYECAGGRFAFRIGERACTNQYKPPYRPGDILYVRETWQTTGSRYIYKADVYNALTDDIAYKLLGWRPSIHMPREAARIFLRVTDVRVEKLQNITDEQALAEGVPEDGDYPLENPMYCPKCKGVGLLGALHPVSLGYMEVDCSYCDTPKKRFSNLWDSTIKSADRALCGWKANPWVWAIAFERLNKNE